MQGQVIGSYQILRRLGEGGMGVVYEAVHQQIKRHAAIKLLHAQYSQNPQLAQRFLNEAKAVNIVQHPGLVEVYEYGQLPDKTAYIVMEYLAGETLKQLLERQGGPLSVPDALRWTRQLAGTLAAAHACGVIHRDLKPENVMIVADPQAEGGQRTKVLDFGIAKLAAEHAEEESSHTETGLMMGTPAYMSPEQCLGAGRADDRADVYSLGVMLYQMLAGRVPFIADGKGALILMHMTQKPPPLHALAPRAPAALVALAQRMLAKKKEERPSMTQVASLIAELEAGRFPARRRWRTPALWVGCGFLVVTGSSALLIYRHNPPSLRPPPTKLASPAGPTPVVPPGPPPNADSPVATAQRPLAAPTEVAKDALTLLAPPLITIPAKPAAAKNRAEHRRTGRAPPAASDPPLQAAQQPPAASGRTGLIERTPEFE